MGTFKEVNSTHISVKIAEMIMEVLKTEKISNETVFQAIKEKFTLEEKEFMATAFVLGRLQSINRDIKNNL